MTSDEIFRFIRNALTQWKDLELEILMLKKPILVTVN